MDREIFYTGQVKGGKIVGIPRKRINEELAYFEGKHIEVVIRKRKRQRTTEQNNTMWMYFTMIAEETGYSKDEVYGIVTKLYLTRTKVNEATGAIYEYIIKTSSLSTVEFNEFFEDIKRFAAQEFNLVLPDPNEQIKML